MGGMRFQFSMSTLLLATTFIFAGMTTYRYRNDYRNLAPWRLIAQHMVFSSLSWIPIVLLGYAIGRTALNIQIVVAVVITELFAIIAGWRFSCTFRSAEFACLRRFRSPAKFFFPHTDVPVPTRSQIPAGLTAALRRTKRALPGRCVPCGSQACERARAELRCRC